MRTQNIDLYNFLSLSWVLVILLQVFRLEYNYIYLPILVVFILYNSFVIIKVGRIFLPFDFLSLNVWIFFVLTIYVFGMTFFYGNMKVHMNL